MNEFEQEEPTPEVEVSKIKPLSSRLNSILKEAMRELVQTKEYKDIVTKINGDEDNSRDHNPERMNIVAKILKTLLMMELNASLKDFPIDPERVDGITQTFETRKQHLEFLLNELEISAEKEGFAHPVFTAPERGFYDEISNINQVWQPIIYSQDIDGVERNGIEHFIRKAIEIIKEVPEYKKNQNELPGGLSR